MCSSVLAALLGFSAVASAQTVDRTMINRIVDEGFNHSELPQTAEYLMDVIGGRMTNSPQMRAAEKWTQEKFRGWNLPKVYTEGYDFGRGWSIERIEVRMLTPRVLALHAIPVAWTPSTPGTLKAPIVVAPMHSERDFDKWRGKFKGAIVLVSKPSEGSESEQAVFHRLTDDEIAKENIYRQPTQSHVEFERNIKKFMAFDAKLDAFLAAEGALASVTEAYKDGGYVHGNGYAYRVGSTLVMPSVELAAEDYRKLARLEKAGAAPTMELTSTVRYYDDDHNAYNIFAEIPGRDAKAGYVMGGGHLDSWVAGDGAADDGAGAVTVMEAARILAKLGIKPKRAIRFALWSGEEQGALGSTAYVERHLAERPPTTDPQVANMSGMTWFTRWPITVKPGHAELAAYFNMDDGSGKIRGIYTEGNVAVVPIFREWLEPFAAMGACNVVAKPNIGGDHAFIQAVGIPAFQFLQDPLDYVSRTYHSNIDTYDHLKIADLKQAAVIMASMLWLSAEREQPLPRKPVPRKPNETNPFSYDDPNEE